MPGKDITLLQTKLLRPRLTRDLVVRPRLVEMLQRGLERRLTLVCAPAGFGKTTLVSAWVESLSAEDRLDSAHQPAAWLSLDEFDSDLLTFLHYVVAAISTIYNDAFPETRKILAARQRPPVKRLASILANEINRLPKSFILVLDDYHTITDEAVHDLINLLVDHTPQPIHLVLISRTTPPLPLARLRANAQITEIRSRDLRFTPEETLEFLNRTTRIWLSPSTMDLIDQRLEGWIAGLRLTMETLKITSESSHTTETILATASGIDNAVAIYLMDEVLSRQLPAIQNFLLKTSILDRFCASLCEAIIGEVDPAWSAQACIDWIDRSELFIIPLDNQRMWYRYHPLFQELLMQRLQVESGGASAPQQVNKLHRLAAVWFAENGAADLALKHALQSGDLELVAQTMQHELRDVLNREDHPTLEGWLRLLPEGLIQRHPGLMIIKLWTLHFSWQLEPLSKSLQQAEILLNRYREAMPLEDWQILQAQVYALQGETAYFNNQPEIAIACCKKALAILPETWTFLRSGIQFYIGLGLRARGENRAAEQFLLSCYESLGDKSNNYALRLLMGLCLIYLPNGALDQVYHTARVMRSRAIDWNLPILQSWGDFFLGVIYYEWNDLEAARTHFEALTRQLYSGHFLAVRDGITGLALICQLNNQSVEAQQLLELLSQLDIARTGAESDQTCSLRARLDLLSGDLESAFRWANSFTKEPDEQPLTWLEDTHLTKARILLAHRSSADLAQALQLLEPLSRIAEKTYNVRYQIYIQTLFAIAYYRQGDSKEALRTLSRAIDLAAPGNFIRVFVELGTPMQELLGQLIAAGHQVESANRILSAFPAPTNNTLLGAPQNTDKRSQTELVEPLTRREIEILTLLREPLSLKEIGERMGISMETAKRHAINVYSKFGVHSRWEAVSKAVKLEILPPR